MTTLRLLFLLALVALPARAQIVVWTPTDHNVFDSTHTGGNFNLLTGSVQDSNPPSTFYLSWSSPTVRRVYIQPTGPDGAAFVASDGSPYIADRLAYGDSVAGLDFTNWPYAADIGDLSAWSTGGIGYLGLKVVQGADTYYGWARISIDSSGDFTLEQFAYNSTPGADIAAGATAIPEPSACALLLGVAAVGVGLFCRQRTGR